MASNEKKPSSNRSFRIVVVDSPAVSPDAIRRLLATAGFKIRHLTEKVKKKRAKAPGENDLHDQLGR